MQMDYVRQVQMEMMDDMIERADVLGDYDPDTGKFKSSKYKRDPYVGENGEFAKDQPEEGIAEMAKQQVLPSQLLLIPAL
jgi:hypothetical protein